jgi:DNA-binding transcriptional LysR family regulator
MTTAQQVQALHDGRVHVGFVRPPIEDETLALETLLQEPLMVVLPEGQAPRIKLAVAWGQNEPLSGLSANW